MATPSLSATFNFVKKYPITLCGFSLLFMPSIHRLLLYFTPLLLSTAIFIVAMMSWGPSAPSEQSTTRRSKPKLVSEHHEWAFNDSLGMDEEEEEDEEDQVDTKVFHDCKASMDSHKQEITQKGEVEPDVGLKLRGELEPEGGDGEDDDAAEMASSDANCQAEPDPALAEEEADTAEEAASGADCQAGTGPPACQVVPDHAGTPASQAEPDPDLQGDGVGTASKNDNAGHHVEMDVHDDDAHAHGGGHAHASHGMGHPHQHKHMQEGVPAERLRDYLQVCA